MHERKWDKKRKDKEMSGIKSQREVEKKEEEEKKEMVRERKKREKSRGGKDKK